MITRERHELQTPAKLNLGLEILGKRPDGYHEIRTIFQAVSIFDRLTFAPATVFEFVNDRRIDPSSDVARPILESAAEDHVWKGKLTLRKSIPIAAGLGGGSSDAALALRLAAGGSDVDRKLAQSLGADVPFFLHGGAAVGTGIGDELRPIDTAPCWFVVNVPPVDISDKTKTLYHGLCSADFTDGEIVERLAIDLTSPANDELPNAFPNAFERQMLRLEPVRSAWTVMRDIAGRVALSGAGPAVFSWHRDKIDANETCAQVSDRLPGESFLCRSLPPHGNDWAIRQFFHLLGG